MKHKTSSENLYWVWLAEILGAGSRNVTKLMSFFGSSFDVYNATEEELVRAGCVSEQIASKLANKSLKRAYEILDYCAINNIGILSYSDKNYPERLRLLQDPPAVLYYKGTLPSFDEKVCIAMVGTRKMSEYGKKSAYKIAYELASAGAVVVSGMALGNDAVAACGALAADGVTVAVLGSGIDVVYPPQHAILQRAIEDRGVVITEYAPGTRPFGANFPMRNRIISGLCQGTLIVEADAISGALITAKCALMQGRGVYALPGNIDEINSEGTNSLIRDGATVVTCANDILINYEFLYGKSLNYSALDFAKSTFDYSLSDKVFAKLGIAFREGKKSSSVNEDDSSSRLRPTRRPKSVEETDRPTTNKSTTKKKRPIIEIPKRSTDGSSKILEALDPEIKAIFDDIPLDRAISIDYLCSLGHNISKAMSAVTMLEMKGLINSLPGNLYIRR